MKAVTLCLNCTLKHENTDVEGLSITESAMFIIK